ncbi:MAG: translocation protein TolB, partial [Alphaproteobacteria bacterium]
GAFSGLNCPRTGGTPHGSAWGDVVVAEDGGNMELVLITPDGGASALLRVTGQDESEIAGPAFDPSGTRLYFSSQRGDGAGITYEVSGPFRRGGAGAGA